MNRVARACNESGFFHVMVQGINKKYIFEKSVDKEEYLSLMLNYRSKFKIKLLAYCIMDNHAHLLIYTDEINEMSKYMRIINSKFAKEYNKSINRVGYVFRDRFNSQYIDSQSYLIKCLKYIHLNPVVAAMVKKPEEYKFSSYNDYLKRTGIVDKEFVKNKCAIDEGCFNLITSDLEEEIEVMDVEREDKNFEICVKKYLRSTNSSIDKIKSNKKMLKDFCSYLVEEKNYKQSQVAKLLEFNIEKIYYIIRRAKKD